MTSSSYLFNRDNLQTQQHGSLRLGRWRAHGKERGRVVLLPGRGDFLEKYTPLATFLSARGHVVISLDWPGQGGSERLGRHPQAGHIRSYDEYTRALEVCLETYGLQDKPQMWLAYSLGALVAVQALLKHAYPVKKLVLLSPMFGFANPPEGITRVLASTAEALGLSRRFALGERPTKVASWRVESSQVSSSPVAFAAYKTFLEQRPDYVIGGSTWGWVKASLAAFRALHRADLSELRLPVLLLAAQTELTVARKAQSEVMKRLPNAELCELPGKHDLLLSEPEEVERLFQRIAAFLGVLPSSKEGC